MQSNRISSAESGPGHAPTILIVDREPEVRAAIAELLGEFGYRVALAESGDKALALLRELPDLPLLLTEIPMQAACGGELADVATERYPDLKVIQMGSYCAGRALNRRFLKQPFRVRDLLSALRAELAVVC